LTEPCRCAFSSVRAEWHVQRICFLKILIPHCRGSMDHCSYCAEFPVFGRVRVATCEIWKAGVCNDANPEPSRTRRQRGLVKRAAFAVDQRLGTPDVPAIRFARGTVFAATVRNRCGLSGCGPPSTDLAGLLANRGFYFQVARRSPFLLLLDMITTTGLLCWLHPQQWQLASLHWPRRSLVTLPDHVEDPERRPLAN
jgi:hypothetical protein